MTYSAPTTSARGIRKAPTTQHEPRATSPNPLLDLRLFGYRSFSAALLVLLSFGMMGGIYLFVTQYLQLVQDLSALTAGLWLLPPASALIVSSMLTPIIARTMRPGYILGAAAAISALGYVVLAMVDSISGLPVLVVGFTLVYIGTGPVMALGTDLVVATCGCRRLGHPP